MGDISIMPVELRLTIRLLGALHIGTGLGLGQLLDSTIMQGPHPENPGVQVPYIPGSSLKGRLRHHTRRLAEALYPLDSAKANRANPDRALFGVEEAPGGLRFADAHLASEELVAKLGNLPATALLRSERSFVAISRQRRVALEQRLFRIELATPDLVFSATITGSLSAATARGHLGLLCAAAADMTHLGGHKARGLGHCAVELTSIQLNGKDTDWRTLVGEL